MGSLTFHGHSCFEVRFGKTNLIIDPFLTGNPTADIGPDDLGTIDAVLLTHGHADHVGDTVAIAKKHQSLVVATYELATFLGTQGLSNVHAMHIGGAYQFPFGKLKMVPAIHGGWVEADESGRFTSVPAGLVLDAEGTAIYHCGDTALTMDMKLLDGRINIMLVPIGDNFTMGIEDAARAVSFVKPQIVVPIHHGTWPPITVDPTEFVTAVGSAAQVNVMQPGDVYGF